MHRLTLNLRNAIRVSIELNGGVYETKAVKHHVILHYPDLVRRFGAMLYMSCEMWDSAHKYMIKSHLASHGSLNFRETVERRVKNEIL